MCVCVCGLVSLSTIPQELPIHQSTNQNSQPHQTNKTNQPIPPQHTHEGDAYEEEEDVHALLAKRQQQQEAGNLEGEGTEVDADEEVSSFIYMCVSMSWCIDHPITSPPTTKN
jgi:hypothetical protein